MLPDQSVARRLSTCCQVPDHGSVRLMINKVPDPVIGLAVFIS